MLDVVDLELDGSEHPPRESASASASSSGDGRAVALSRQSSRSEIAPTEHYDTDGAKEEDVDDEEDDDDDIPHERARAQPTGQDTYSEADALRDALSTTPSPQEK